MAILKAIKRLLLALVALVVLFYVVLFATMTYQMSREPVMSRDDVEVQFAIGWLGPPAAEAELLDSYRPPAGPVTTKKSSHSA